MTYSTVLLFVLAASACGGLNSGTFDAGADFSSDLATADSMIDLQMALDSKSAGDANIPCNCLPGRTCCSGKCVDIKNDIFNCGACGVVCESPTRYCDGKQCASPPCDPACPGNQLCCTVTTTVTTLGCYDPVKDTCPINSCSACQ